MTADTLITPVIIGIGLSMDCFAVAVAAGVHSKIGRIRAALILAAFFGAFQAAMTLAGFFAASGFASLITAYDHWVAAGLLFIIGTKMIREGFGEEEEEPPDLLNLAAVAGLAVATSIDALAVGIGFAFLGVEVLIPALIIGMIAALVSCAGVFFGGTIAGVLGRRVDIAGGLVLVLIGIRILAEHRAWG